MKDLIALQDKLYARLDNYRDLQQEKYYEHIDGKICELKAIIALIDKMVGFRPVDNPD